MVSMSFEDFPTSAKKSLLLVYPGFLMEMHCPSLSTDLIWSYEETKQLLDKVSIFLIYLSLGILTLEHNGFPFQLVCGRVFFYAQENFRGNKILRKQFRKCVENANGSSAFVKIRQLRKIGAMFRKCSWDIITEKHGRDEAIHLKIR